jgi:hypothetical protein
MRVVAVTATAVEAVAARAAPPVRTPPGDVLAAGAPEGCELPAQAVTMPAAAIIAAARVRVLIW